LLLLASKIASAQPVSFPAKDGVKIFGDFNAANGKSRGTIVLFHMAGSNRAEYAPLAPILNADGFNACHRPTLGRFPLRIREPDSQHSKAQLQFCRRHPRSGSRDRICRRTTFGADRGMGIELFGGARLCRRGQASGGESAFGLLARRIYRGLFNRERSPKAVYPCIRDICLGSLGNRCSKSPDGRCSEPSGNPIHSEAWHPRLIDPAGRRGSIGLDENWKHVKDFLDKALPKT
jgi:hypothetical protein